MSFICMKIKNHFRMPFGTYPRFETEPLCNLTASHVGEALYKSYSAHDTIL